MEERPFLDQKSINHDDETSPPSPAIDVHGSNEQKLLWPAVATAVACLGAWLFGFTVGFTSPTVMAMQGETKKQVFVDLSCEGDDTVTSSKAALFGSVVSLGSMIGALAGGHLADAIGRKYTIAISAVPYAAGYLWLAVTTDANEVILTRMLTGAGLGIASVAVPMYITEVAPVHFRGVLGACNQLAVTLGIFGVYLIGDQLDHKETSFNGCEGATTSTIGDLWPVVAWVGAAVSCALFVLALLFLPRSPVYLIKRGQHEAARAVCVGLWGNDYNPARALGGATPSESQERGSFRDLLVPSMRRTMLIGCGMLVLQQVSGVNAVIFYAGPIFKDAGQSNADRSGLYVMSVQVAATLVSVILMERVGRRTLLLISSAGMAVSAGLLGLFFVLKTGGGPREDWLALLSLMGYIVSFSLGMGPVPWLLIAEIFPDRNRAVAASVGATIGWLASFLVTQTFTYLTQGLETFGAFWLYGGICAGTFVFVYSFVPETRGLPKQQIQILLQGSVAPQLTSRYHEINKDDDIKRIVGGEIPDADLEVYGAKDDIGAP